MSVKDNVKHALVNPKDKAHAAALDYTQRAPKFTRPITAQGKHIPTPRIKK